MSSYWRRSMTLPGSSHGSGLFLSELHGIAAPATVVQGPANSSDRSGHPKGGHTAGGDAAAEWIWTPSTVGGPARPSNLKTNHDMVHAGNLYAKAQSDRRTMISELSNWNLLE
eukprot:Skav224704  [mRNA]  locus=scaffold699:183456:183794:+ [translate_table: standard]